VDVRNACRTLKKAIPANIHAIGVAQAVSNHRLSSTSALFNRLRPGSVPGSGRSPLRRSDESSRIRTTSTREVSSAFGRRRHESLRCGRQEPLSHTQESRVAEQLQAPLPVLMFQPFSKLTCTFSIHPVSSNSKFPLLYTIREINSFLQQSGFLFFRRPCKLLFFPMSYQRAGCYCQHLCTTSTDSCNPK
jgi:hypothetical protein